MRYLLMLLLLTLFGCKHDATLEATSIEADKRIRIDLDRTANDALPDLQIQSVVPLATSEVSLIRFLSGLEYHDGKIYVLDIFGARAVLAFSENGDFLRKTKSGKGPGEMINPFALYLDRDDHSVYVWDQGMLAIFRYDADLEFVGQEAFANPLSNFAILADGRTLMHTHYFQDFVFKIYGPDNQTVEQEFIPDLEYGGGVGLGRSISTHKRTLLVTPYQHYIYEWRDNTIDTAYHIDLGKYELSRKDVEFGPNNDRMGNLRELIQQGKKASSLNDIAQGDSFLSFRVYFKSEVLNFAYSFPDREVYYLNEYIDKKLLPVCSVKGITADDRFYALVDPADLDDFQQATGTTLIDGEINLEGNPYFMMFTLGSVSQQ